FDIALQFFGHSFIRVDAEDPVIACLLSGKVFLSRVTGPRSNIDSIGECASDFSRSIGALRVDDDDLIGPGERFQSSLDVVLFVKRDDGGGDFHWAGPFCLTSSEFARERQRAMY